MFSAVLFFGIASVGIGPSDAAVYVALVPSAATVTSGSDFQVVMRVTQAGSPFNAYQAIVHYDPAAVTFVQAVPVSLQEGSYMTGACGATFHWFTSGTTEVGIVHSILCAGMSLTGPGELYILHFRATGSAQTTPITINMVDFANAGDPVTPVNVTNASIVITLASDAQTPPHAQTALHIAPNPFNPSTVIEVDSEHAGPQSIAVYTPTGRLVRELENGFFPAGSRRIVWNGRRDDGTRLASGMYIVRFRAQDDVRSARVVLLK